MHVPFIKFHELLLKVFSIILFLYFEVVCDPCEVIITMASLQMAKYWKLKPHMRRAVPEHLHYSHRNQ